MPYLNDYDGYANYYSWLVIVARRNIPKNLFMRPRNMPVQTGDRKSHICSYEGQQISLWRVIISPLTDINTGKVGRESNKNEFLKAKCYSLPC